MLICFCKILYTTDIALWSYAALHWTRSFLTTTIRESTADHLCLSKETFCYIWPKEWWNTFTIRDWFTWRPSHETCSSTLPILAGEYRTFSPVLMKRADFGLNGLSSYMVNAIKDKVSDETLWLAPEILNKAYDPSEGIMSSTFFNIMYMKLIVMFMPDLSTIYENNLFRGKIERLFETIAKTRCTEFDVYSEGLVFLYVLLDGKFPKLPNTDSCKDMLSLAEFIIPCIKSI